MNASEHGQSKASLRDQQVVSVKEYSRPPLITKLIRFRLRLGSQVGDYLAFDPAD